MVVVGVVPFGEKGGSGGGANRQMEGDTEKVEGLRIDDRDG